jgi:hypothetical protein
MMPVTSAEGALLRVHCDGEVQGSVKLALTSIKVVSASDAAVTKDCALNTATAACFQKPVNTQDFLGAVQKAPGQAAVPRGT